MDEEQISFYQATCELAEIEIEIESVALTEPHRVAEHLDLAERHYHKVQATRRDRYESDNVEAVITCVFGLAIVAYLRATLLDLPPERKIELLVRAERDALESAQRWAARHNGRHEGANIGRSLRLALKALAARMEVIRTSAVRPPTPPNEPNQPNQPSSDSSFVSNRRLMCPPSSDQCRADRSAAARASARVQRASRRSWCSTVLRPPRSVENLR